MPVLVDYFQTGYVPRFPTLIGSVSLFGFGTLLIIVGLIVDGTRKTRNELSRLIYLSLPASTYATADAAGRAEMSRQ